MTKKHRRHSTSKKREVVEAYFNGESMRALSQRHDICRTLIPIWIDKYERGEFDDDAIEEELLPKYETRIAALERLVGRQALEIEFLKTARAHTRSQRNGSTSVITGPSASRSDGGAN
ncbi:transposase [Paracoccus rhizosphaerae]|uniref:Transposase n=1 Tax=Paracoccus rhizosphaerae TaxID=1133347 RepID=A0ABV6CL01_9RHOB